MEFLDSLDEDSRRAIQYGMMLLKKLSDFKVTFVREYKDTIYEMRTALIGVTYSSYFYLNGETLVFLHGCMIEKHRRTVSSDAVSMNVVRALRWKHVTGELSAVDYDAVLDGLYGASGATRREVFEMRACSNYVSQTLRTARIDAGLQQADIFLKWGLKVDCGNLFRAEDGRRVLPFKYLACLVDTMGYKAIVVRPGLRGWNAISREKTLEQMRLEIGEQVYRWHPKDAGND